MFVGTNAKAEILTELNQQAGDREYTFTSPNEVYTVTESFGTTAEGKFTINGAVGEDGSKTVIDFNGKRGFQGNSSHAFEIYINNIVLKNSHPTGSLTDGGFFYNENNDAGNHQKLVLKNVDLINNIGQTWNACNGGAIDFKNAEVIIDNSNFIENGALGGGRTAMGGAISFFENNVVEYIKANFTGNYVIDSSGALGGAIASYNGSSTILGGITGDFINNYAKSGSGYATGGAIYANDATIGNIVGDFKGNYTESKYNKENYFGGYGGAITNYNSKISKITGNFENNYAVNIEGVSGTAGGAIYNRNNAEITNGIEGNFTGNYAKTSGTSANGGAIYNLQSAKIGDINGNFTNNYAQSDTGYAYGGAILNGSSSIIGNIKGNFTNNYVIGSGKYAIGGAIINYSSSSIGNIIGNFIKNSALAKGTYAAGGAIYNQSATIGSIAGDFIGNYVKTTGTYA